ncbi:hypothetical protein GCM10023069_14370 [Shinella granuli]
MEGFQLKIFKSLAMAFAISVAASHAVAQTPVSASVDSGVSDVAGQWQGSISCRGDEVNFDLELEADGALLRGSLRFQSGDVSGSHAVTGRYTPRTRSLTIIPGSWQERPAGWRAATISAILHENGLSLKGSANACGPDSGTHDLIAKRPGAEEETPAAAARFVPSLGGPFEGHWTGRCIGERREFIISMDVLQEEDTVIAFMKPKDFRPQQLRGRIVDGKANLVNLALAQTYQALELSLGADERMTGRKTDGGANCNKIELQRQGPAQTPSLAGKEWLTGDWAGYYAGDGPNNQRRFFEEWSYRPTFAGNAALLTIGEADGQAYGYFRLASPPEMSAERQDNYWITLRPLFTDGDGRIVFSMSKLHRSEGRSYAKTGPINIVASPFGSDEGLLVERYRFPGKPVLFHMQAVAPESRLLSHPTEGPPLRLSDAMTGTLVEAQTLDQQCELLGNWMSDIADRENLGRMQVRDARQRILPILYDEQFVPLAGLPFSLLESYERWTFLTWLRTACPSRMGWPRYPSASVEDVFRGDDYHKTVGMLVDHQESGGWAEEVVAELSALPDEPDALARIDAIEKGVEARKAELEISRLDEVRAAISTKRNAVAYAAFLVRFEDMDALPDETDSLVHLAKLAKEARGLILPPDANITTRLREKVMKIISPQLDSALHEMTALPTSLESLTRANAIFRDVGAMMGQAEEAVSPLNERERLGQLRERRDALQADPQIRALLVAELDRARTSNDPVVATENAIFGIFGKYEPAGLAPLLAQAREQAAIASIVVVDRAGAFEDASGPSAAEIASFVYRRVKAAAEAQKAKEAACRNGNANNPLEALHCLPIVVGDEFMGGLRPRLVRVEKIGCETLRTGVKYICRFLQHVEIYSGNAGPASPDIVRDYLGTILPGGYNGEVRTAEFERMNATGDAQWRVVW